MVSLRDWWTDKVREWAKLPPRIPPAPDLSHFEVNRQIVRGSLGTPPTSGSVVMKPTVDPVTPLVVVGLMLHEAYGASHGLDAGTHTTG